MSLRWHRIFLGVALALWAAAPFAASASESMTRNLIVKFKDEVSATRALPVRNRLALLAADRDMTLSYVRQMAMQAHVVALDRAVPLSEARAIAAELATHPDVEYAQADRRLKPTFVPNDEYINRQTYLGNGSAAISAFAAWDITTGSPNVVVAVVDTGYRPHAGLAGRFVQGYDFISTPFDANDGNGRDPDASDPGDWVTQADIDGPLRGEDCSVEDSSWHGTAVSAVIGANGND
nr:peptidase [Pseudomonadota bacterium]